MQKELEILIDDLEGTDLASCSRSELQTIVEGIIKELIRIQDMSE